MSGNPLVLSADECERALDLPLLLDEIAKGFVDYSAGRVVVPPVGHLGFESPPGDVHIKYGYVRGDDVFVIKIAAGFPENARRALPTGDGAMLVFDSRTGLLAAVLLDRSRLTDIRTAAAGAVVARALAPANVARIGIVGTGVQARLQLRMLAHVTAARDALVWGRSAERAAAFTEEMREDGFAVRVAADVDALARECDLIVTATTARAPLVRAGAVRPGTHITAVGADAPGKQELDPALFARAALVVADSIAQCADHGDLAHALAAQTVRLDAVRELGDVLRHAFPRPPDAITIADLTGVAVQDIVIAKHVLRGAGRRRTEPRAH